MDITFEDAQFYAVLVVSIVSFSCNLSIAIFVIIVIF